jgi:anti-anti-sigma regulatory factor
MTDAGAGTPAVVVLPADIDLTTVAGAYARLDAAISSGAAVVIADFSATVFCDIAGIRHLLELHRLAAARQVELRLVIPAGGAVCRLLDLIEPAQPLRISSSLGTAGS